MKEKRFIFFLLGLAIGVASIWAMVQSQSTSGGEKPEATAGGLSKITGFEVIDIGPGRCPRFSPDSKKIAFLNQGRLCLANSDGTGEIQKIAPIKAEDFQWIGDQELLYWYEEPTETREWRKVINIVNLKGEKNSLIATEEEKQTQGPPLLLPDGTIGFYKKGVKEGTRTFKVVREGALPPDSALKQFRAQIAFANPNAMYGDIWLVSVDGSIKKRITTNKRFSFPELSPDGKKILAVKIPDGDPYLGGGSYVIDLDGKETWVGDPDIWTPIKDSTAQIFYSITGAGGANWSPGGSKIVYEYARTAPKVEDIDAADIVIKNVDGTGRFQIETPDEMELEPVWSPDGKMIACETYKTNKIRVFKLK